jgi:tetratricopeptide (TPR) repeat protein
LPSTHETFVLKQKMKLNSLFLLPLHTSKIVINMFNKNIKLVITTIILAYAVYQFTEGEIGNGIMYILLSTIFIFLYFKNEMILLSFLKLRKQDFPGAKKWLDKIKNPEGALVKKQQGYLNYLNGVMVSQTNMNDAEKYFKRAIELGLSMDHDLAMAKLNLAGIAFSKRRKPEAQKLLSEAEKLDKRDMLADQIKMMKQQMKKASIPKQQYGQPTSARQNRRSKR